MFGLVYQSLERMIIRRYGLEIWEEICQILTFEISSDYTFCVHKQYDDGLALQIVQVASEIIGISNDNLLEMFGEQFIFLCREAGYGKLLESLAPTLQEFISSLNNLHDHLAEIYSGMNSPRFNCRDQDDGTLIMTYQSSRLGLEGMVVGSIKSIAKEIFNTDIRVVIRKKMTKYTPASFIITYKSIAMIRKIVNLKEIYRKSGKVDRNELLSLDFSSLFPFHFVMTQNFEIIQIGKALSRVLLKSLVCHKKLNAKNIFRIIKPNVDFQFEDIILHTHNQFIFEINHLDYKFRLKGQIVHVRSSNVNSLLFLGSPFVTSIEDIEMSGLYLIDFPIHDATRDVLMMLECSRAEMATAIKMESLTHQLRETQSKLAIEKERANDLLYQMLPVKVVRELMEGCPVTAEKFERVTILFSDITNFVRMVGTNDPMKVVNMLDELYMKFDFFTVQNGVYKIETIGDAYMVVGGIPERVYNHAERIAKQAIDMREASKTVKNISSPKEFVKIRVGIHAGPVVSGVVGNKMPRYCLFGITVSVASKAESEGYPEKIHVTQEVYNDLNGNPLFKFTYRATKSYKEWPKETNSYWLDPGNYMPKCSSELPRRNIQEGETELTDSNVLYKLSKLSNPITNTMNTNYPSLPLSITFPVLNKDVHKGAPLVKSKITDIIQKFSTVLGIAYIARGKGIIQQIFLNETSESKI